VTKTCQVTKVLWAGRDGGTVMNVLVENDPYRVVAGADVMPREPVVGEIWDIDGTVRVNHQYGRQVHASRAILAKPSGRLILSFLKGNNCPGIGAAKATALWDALGEQIYDALADAADTRIGAIIGDNLANVVQSAWEVQEADVVAWRWCDAHGLSVRLSRRLGAIYGVELPNRMAENAYRVLAFTNWKTAERLAKAAAIPRDDPRRLVGAVEAIIFERLDQGHTAVAYHELADAVGQRLTASNELTDQAIELAISDGALIKIGELLAGAGTATMERYVAENLSQRQEVGRAQPDFLMGASSAELRTLLTNFEAGEAMTLNLHQREAAIMAAQEPVSILTGGAGTGKTTALKAIHALADAYGVPVIQAALAGRAARRMTEATSKPARTIMALENAIKAGLKADGSLVVIDESSMLDLPTAYRLLRALPLTARVLLVGDPAQLPPIGFGLILHALIKNQVIPNVELSEVHRQAANTGIPAASLAIRHGNMPKFSVYTGLGSGVSLLSSSPDAFADRLLELKDDMPRAQIITALRDGPSGTNAINSYFHEKLMSGKPHMEGFCVGEPVIWTKNDYKLDLMNGTLGFIMEIGDDGLLIDFEKEHRWIEKANLTLLMHAYAITVHKAQGSQFERVIVPFVQSMIGDRAMLYTAITRATSQVVLLGDAQTLQQAVANLGTAHKRIISAILG
jgi:exodeoxyribonuclease V alpha subunit